MADFNIRSESVDVEQIMNQIRSRIREKRGVDYTEEQIRELATVRLEKFLDPRNLRSDLLDQFRRSRPAVPSEPTPIEAPYEFNDQTLFETHRGPLRFIRQLLKPILKLFFNPNPLINVLHTQAQFNVDMLKREQRRKIEFDRSRAEWNALYYEVLHNLVLETTRSGIEIKNLKMRVEALTSRLDFSERRVRALEGVVQYRPDALRRGDRGDRDPRPLPQEDGGGEGGAASESADGGGADQSALPGDGARRRRRRRRGRRASAGAGPGASGVELSDLPVESGDDATAPSHASHGSDANDRRKTDEAPTTQNDRPEPLRSPSPGEDRSPDSSRDDDQQ